LGRLRQLSLDDTDQRLALAIRLVLCTEKREPLSVALPFQGLDVPLFVELRLQRDGGCRGTPFGRPESDDPCP
jgi:hypothetical protein